MTQPDGRGSLSTAGAPPVGLLDAVSAEWVKLRSLRSTYWSLLAAAVLVMGLGVVFALAYGSVYATATPNDKATFDPTTISLSGVWFGQLAVGVLGILTMTAEYASGTIRPSLAAVPRRRTMFLAKTIVFAGVTFLIGEVASLAAFFVGQPILARNAPHASIGDAGVARALVGSGLYLTVLALFSVALGALLRHTAGAVTAMVALVFAVPTVLGSLPGFWQRSVAPWLPTNAGSTLWTVRHAEHTLAPWTGFAVFVGYTAVIAVAALVTFNRRDI
jgi:ABC-type transport system involved in multi-copper enzyme maturation permease subunit